MIGRSGRRGHKRRVVPVDQDSLLSRGRSVAARVVRGLRSSHGDRETQVADMGHACGGRERVCRSQQGQVDRRVAVQRALLALLLDFVDAERVHARIRVIHELLVLAESIRGDHDQVDHDAHDDE